MTPSIAVSATVRAIHGVRELSRASHDLVAREILIRVERRIMTIIMAANDDGPRLP